MEQKNIKDIKKQLDDFSQLMRDIPVVLQNLNDELNYIQNSLIDIEHFLELKKYNACQGYEIARMITELRNQRREIKDLKLVLVPVNDLINNSKPFIEKLNSIRGEINKNITHITSVREYKPKALYDLFDKKPILNDIELAFKKGGEKVGKIIS